MELALYKLRADLPDDEWGFRATVAEDYRIVPTRPIAGLKSALRIRVVGDSFPPWQADLLAIADLEDLNELRNRHSGALLQVERAGHRFLLAYGAGWQSLESSCLEQSFGLWVAANAVRPDQMKSAETTSFTRRGRAAKVSLANAGPLYELGIETSEELVRQLEGKPPVEFANGLTGGDMLRLKIKDFALKDLAGKLDEIIRLHGSTAYKKHFPFLDYYRRVARSDSNLIGKLERGLTAQFGTDPGSLCFADPESHDREPDFFLLRAGRSQAAKVYDLDPTEVFDIAVGWGVADPLHKVSVEAHYPQGDRPTSEKLLRYAAGDVRMGGELFTLRAGNWYQVDATHFAQIEKRLDTIEEVDAAALGLPSWVANKDEGRYNEEAVAANSGLLLLDKRLFRSGHANHRVEICDILTSAKQMICVKKTSRSSTMSHLFAQGLVSATLLAEDEQEYRPSVLRHLKRLRPEATYEPQADWSVIYAIGTRKRGPLVRSLPFFSKINLDRTRSALQRLGITVQVARIELV